VSKTSPHYIFEEAMFEPAPAWIELYADARFTQRYRIVGTRMYTESVAAVHTDVDALCQALRGPWDWWRHGRYEAREEREDGTVHYDLWPTGSAICVHEVMHAPREVAGGSVRLPIVLSGHASGTAYFDLRETAQGSVMTGRFAGVTLAGFLPRLMGTKRFAINHLLAERGALGFPFPKGTGWIGLIERLEGR
jgi:hypothetical protein